MRKLIGAVAFLGLAVGCSDPGPPMGQLSGKVTFKGQPVPAGWISFTPDVAGGGKGQVRVCQIRDGVYDSAKEGDPGINVGPNFVKIAGFDGKKVPLWGQGKQIFNPVDDKHTVPAGVSTKDFEVPESAGKNVKVQPTSDPE